MKNPIKNILYLQKMQSVAFLSKLYNIYISLIEKSINLYVEMNLIEDVNIIIFTIGIRDLQFKNSNKLDYNRSVIELNQLVISSLKENQSTYSQLRKIIYNSQNFYNS